MSFFAIVALFAVIEMLFGDAETENKVGVCGGLGGGILVGFIVAFLVTYLFRVDLFSPLN